jgi:hypothetical protein
MTEKSADNSILSQFGAPPIGLCAFQAEPGYSSTTQSAIVCVAPCQSKSHFSPVKQSPKTSESAPLAARRAGSLNAPEARRDTGMVMASGTR